MPSDLWAFSGTAIKENALWPPDIYFDCPSRKHLATTMHFFQLLIQKMLNNYQVFSLIANLENS
jgi:hypothetical protein